MRYKVGDEVVVITTEKAYAECIGAIGKIVDVDDVWAFPYEVEFYNEDLRGKQIAGHMQDLFREEELEFRSVVEAKVAKAMEIEEPLVPDMSAFKKVSIEDEIKRLVERVSNELPKSRPASMVITKLDEARLWLGEVEND
jgi:hypothetical protein